MSLVHKSPKRDFKPNLAGNYMPKVNNRNVTSRCKICPKLTIKIPERRLTYFTPCSSVSIVNFEQVNVAW